MDKRIVEKHGFSKLPLEVIGLILKKLNGEDAVEELKKCRLVLPRLYKAVQDLFQDEFDGKLCTHFDGLKLNYSTSRSFGMNIFGSYKLNFPTVKISRAEFYLMKSWLEKLIPTNIQYLELKDNLLNWMEIIDILAKFPKIVQFKYIQSSEDMILADKIHNLYSIDDNDEYINDDFFIKMEQLILDKNEFLPQLKTFEVEVVHWNIANILTLLVHYSKCHKLEKFSLKVDIFGISKSEYSQYYSVTLSSAELYLTQLNSLYYLARFASSMKSIEIIIDDSKLPQCERILFNNSLNLPIIQFCSYSVLDIFSKENLIKFTQLESLVLKSPLICSHQILEKEFQLTKFIKKQKNLKNLEISYFGFRLYDEEAIQFLNNLMVHGNRIRFGFQVDFTRGFGNILEFPENLSGLKVTLVQTYTTWRFSDANIPKFPNCLEMRIENFYHENWDNYQFQSIIEKFQNLEKLVIWSDNWNHGPQVFDQDLQLIIKGLTHLKMIHFEDCANSMTDSALTGLTPEAVEARRGNPSEPLGPQDRTGLPISHLKNLESLIIISKDFELEISDITAHHAFENMPKLKFLNIYYSNITREGFDTIMEKTGSKNLNIKEQLLPFVFENEDDIVEDDNEV